MKKIVVLMVLGVLTMGFTASTAFAQEAAAAEAPAPKQDEVTEAELARILVQQLGMARFLPASPTDFDCFSILLANGVSPGKDGWKGDRVVTRATLARTIVQAMGLADKVENKDDPQAWINVLTEMGVSLDTIGIAVETIVPDPTVPVIRNIPQTAEDPLLRQFIPVSEDDIFGIFAQVSLPPVTMVKKPVTPN